MKSVLILGAAAALLASCTAQPKKENSSAEIQKPNVIFLVADDIGFGDFSCNGATEISTPNVDKLASQGVRFTDAHAVAATSTPTGIAAGNAGMVIRPEQPTVADMFQSCGYATGAVGKWHLGLANKTGEQDWNGFITPGPKDIGFEYSYIMAATGDRVPCCWVENQRIVNLDPNDPIEVSYTTPFPGEPLGKDHPELLTKLKPSVNHGHDQAIVNGISRIGYMKGGKQALWEDEFIAESITTKAVQFIDRHKDEPFFLYVGTNDVHVPRYPHPRFQGKSGMGFRGDALLQFEVVDDGYQDRAVELLGNHRPWGEFRGGKYSNFEAGTRVPLIVSWPKQVKPAVSDALVSHIDLYASMAKLMGKTLEAGAGVDSQDYLDAFLGKDTKGRDYVIEFAGALSVSDGQWKYITPNNKPAYAKLTNTELGNSPEDQLYHLKEDIGEKNNVASEHPDIVAKLKKILETESSK